MWRLAWSQWMCADLLSVMSPDQAGFAEEGQRDLPAKVHGGFGPLLGWVCYPCFIDEEPEALRS